MDSRLGLAGRGLIAAVLIVGVPKALDPPGFVNDIYGWAIVSREAALIFAFHPPWHELISSLGFLVKR